VAATYPVIILIRLAAFDITRPGNNIEPSFTFIQRCRRFCGLRSNKNQVNVKTAATSDEMVSLMAKGGYDLVTASGDASLRPDRACRTLYRRR
jgi:hypothetical protein